MIRPKLLLLGIDGLCRDVLDYALQHVELPNLSRLLSEGYTVPMPSTLLPTSGTAWTSICTGVGPGKHGITGFVHWERTPFGHFGTRLANSHDVPVEYFWETAARSGVPSLVIRVPLTYPPRPYNGCIVTEEDFSRASIYPVELEPFLQSSKIPDHWVGADDWKELVPQVIRGTGTLVRTLYEKTRPDICFPVFYTLDFINHRDGYRTAFFAEMLQIVDTEVGTLLEMDSFTDVAIISDHGMRIFDGCFMVEPWLLAHGHMVWSPTTNYVDWAGSAAYSTPSDIPGNYGKLYININVLTPQERRIRLERIAAELLATQIGGAPAIENIWFGDDIYTGPQRDKMPDLVFRTARNMRVSSMWDAEFALQKECYSTKAWHPLGCHQRTGLFCWRNADLHPVQGEGNVQVYDVSAWVLSRFGVPLPDNYDASHPSAFIGETPLFPMSPCQPAMAITIESGGKKLEEEREMVESLSSLGYM